MKKTLLILAAILSYSINYAQSNLIIFTENGEAFTLTVDGSPAVNISDSKVAFDGIKGDFVQAKITFRNPALGEIKKGLMIEPNVEMTATLKKNKKGAYVIRPVSSVAIASAPKRPFIAPPVSEESPNTRKNDVQITSGGSSTIPTTNTATQSINSGAGTTNNTESHNMNVNININNVGVGVAQNVSNTTTTTNSIAMNPNHTTTEEMGEDFEVVCAPMTSGDYASAKKSIGNKSFAEDKMIVAKQILRANCVSTDQVIGIMNLFSFEANKVEFAKAAYDKTTDKGNYYKVNDAFTYSSSIDELNEFLGGE